MKFTTIVSLCVALFLSFSAFASDRRYDDRNHLISPPEVASLFIYFFTQIDHNHDRFISRKEYKRHRNDMYKRQADRRFDRLDRNNDGYISGRELKYQRHQHQKYHRKHEQSKSRLFNRCDRNHDGLVTRREARRCR